MKVKNRFPTNYDMLTLLNVTIFDAAALFFIGVDIKSKIGEVEYFLLTGIMLFYGIYILFRIPKTLGNFISNLKKGCKKCKTDRLKKKNSN